MMGAIGKQFKNFNQFKSMYEQALSARDPGPTHEFQPCPRVN